MLLTLGERLADLRYSKKVTQAEAAKCIGTSKTSLAHWETNKNKPDIIKLKRIAEYYDVSTDYLLGRVESQYDFAHVDSIFVDAISNGDLHKRENMLSDDARRKLLEYLAMLEMVENREK